MNNKNGFESYVWVRKDVLKEVQQRSLTPGWKPSSRKRGRDSWQWVRAKLLSTADKQDSRQDLSSSPYGQVRLRRVNNSNSNSNSNSSSNSKRSAANGTGATIKQRHVTILVDDPEAGADLQNQSFSFDTSSNEPLVQMANSWWSTGADAPQDLTTLNHLHEPAVVYCLRKRYEADLIYTYTGRILLALNPFRQILSLYGQKMMDTYEESSEDRPPHVYATAQDAYSTMMRNSRNQSILVSGESGAGKTVTTKIILAYLTTLSKWKVVLRQDKSETGIESQGESATQNVKCRSGRQRNIDTLSTVHTDPPPYDPSRSLQSHSRILWKCPYHPK